jgi:hypothetical protein
MQHRSVKAAQRQQKVAQVGEGSEMHHSISGGIAISVAVAGVAVVESSTTRAATKAFTK